ncbi:peptidoglycan-binding domain-containing protein [Ideonella sp. DXS29W]|uniref:Peptidoglycan-binding domain-containing protein n=1 Tax=Ideonella lacteola TaxID=2984193 RepID=A0ABU9BV35_9BURK
MDTRIIDVVIGVALVFAITSLLATALQELWASMRSLRGEYLKKAVASFVGDDAKFAEGLLAHPIVVSMASGTKQDSRKPSYLTSDVVVSSLVGHLTGTLLGGIRPQTPAEWVSEVKAAVGKAQGASSERLPNVDFTAGLVSVLAGVEHDWPAFETRLAAWYDAVCERSTGWFKRHTQVTLFVFGLLIAGFANINPIVISARLWQDEALRNATVEAAKRASAAYGDEVSRQSAAASTPESAASHATAPIALPALINGSTSGAPPSLPAAREATRAVPQALQARLAELSQALQQQLAPPADPGAGDGLSRALMAAIALRESLKVTPLRASEVQTHVQSIEAALASNAGAGPTLRLAADVRKEVASFLVPPPLATVPPPLATAATAASTPKGRTTPTECAPLSPAEREFCTRLNDLNALQSIGLPIGWVNGAWPTYFKNGAAAWWGNLLLALAGWCLTAIACTLGGPFWFDLLSKLVKMRGAGSKPAPESVASATGGAAGEPTKSLLSRSPISPTVASTPADPMSDALNDAERALSVAEIERLQRALPMPPAAVSGSFDAATRQAIRQWQSAGGMEATAELTAVQIQQLLGLAPGGLDDDYLG